MIIEDLEIIKEDGILLSVVVAVYNVKDYIDDCLSSLAEQTIKDVEFIVVDDGSTDGSKDICDQWGKRDKRFVIIHHENNKGLLITRKTGVLKSRGNWVTFLDGDDKLDKEALKEMLHLVNKKSVDIIQFSIDVFNCENKYQYISRKQYYKNYNRKVFQSENIAKSMFIDKTILWNLCFKIYKRELLIKCVYFISDIHLVYAEDAYFSFIISFFARSFISCKTNGLYLYRINSGISSKIRYDLQTFSIYLNSILVVSEIEEFLQKNNASKQWYVFFYALKNHLFSTIVTTLDNMPDNVFQEAFSLFYQKIKIISFLPWLEKFIIKSQTKLASAYTQVQHSAYRTNVYKKYTNNNNIKTIGIVYQFNKYNFEFDIISYIQIFSRQGYRVVLFTDILSNNFNNLLNNVVLVQLPISYKQKRAELFIEYIDKYNISVVIYNVSSSKELFWDILCLNEIYIRVILLLHEFLFQEINDCNINNVDKLKVYQLADTVFTLSSSDEIFLKCCGINAKYLPSYTNKNEKTKSYFAVHDKQLVLWIGRLSKESNYKEILKIYRRVVSINKNTKCCIIGVGRLKDKIFIKMFIKIYQLHEKIIYISDPNDIDSWYSKTSILLIASTFELYPKVIVDSKIYGIPIVTYDHPVSDLLIDNHGLISVESHNIEEAANTILYILNNKEKAERLSYDARNSIQYFINFDLDNAWSAIIDESCKSICTENFQSNTYKMGLFWRNILTTYNKGLYSRKSNVKKNLKSKIKFILKLIFPARSRQRFFVVLLYQNIRKIINIILKCYKRILL